jgi:tetratricopeptide (TPR) repeat protein
MGRLFESVEQFTVVIDHRASELDRRKREAEGKTAKWARVADDIGDDRSDSLDDAGGSGFFSQRSGGSGGGGRTRRGRDRGRQNRSRPSSRNFGHGGGKGGNDGEVDHSPAIWSTSFHLDKSKQDEEVQARIEVSASDAMARINRGIALVRLHRFDEAMSDFNAAIEAAPDNAHVYYNRALLFQRMGRSVEAERDLHAAIALKPTDAELYIQRGNAVVLQHRHAMEQDMLRERKRVHSEVREVETNTAAPAKMRLKDAMSDYATALFLAPHYRTGEL